MAAGSRLRATICMTHRDVQSTFYEAKKHSICPCNSECQDKAHTRQKTAEDQQLTQVGTRTKGKHVLRMLCRAGLDESRQQQTAAIIA